MCKRVIAVAGEKITKDNSDTIYVSRLPNSKKNRKKSDT